MRGVLHKTEQGWVVEFKNHDGRICSIPLHPSDLGVPSYVGNILGEVQEVEFEIVRYCKHHNSDPSKNSVCTLDCGYEEVSYAKVIQDNPATVGSTALVDKQEMGIIETMARDFYWSRQPKGKFMAENSRPDMVIGYVEGYNKAKETLYTEEQVREAIKMSRVTNTVNIIGGGVKLHKYQDDEIIQSLKKLK